jgi:DNA ligase (NAD+)
MYLSHPPPPPCPPNSGYDVDGVVLKLDDLSLQRALGHASSDPLWAVALKFPAHEALTRLLDIALNVGRTGQVRSAASWHCAAP